MQAATKAGIDPSTIVRAERTGKWPAQHRTREALMRALGVRLPRKAVRS